MRVLVDHDLDRGAYIAKTEWGKPTQLVIRTAYDQQALALAEDTAAVLRLICCWADDFAQIQIRDILYHLVLVTHQASQEVLYQQRGLALHCPAPVSPRPA